ncbi:hypothetical protein HFO49_22515 [Rhizobium leguminosarum]|uniref:hypothetical protein n=1 Tax=Rhizobium leguminosarum TaxID=384 RepID=UPI001C972C43|nr:hypothetical protein [Rhizobium leguminosarum]MBY5590227.1 hypothetical protein [Rhizobium leguminosarum]
MNVRSSINKVDQSWNEITVKLKSSVMKNVRLYSPPLPATGIRLFLHWVCDSPHLDARNLRTYLANNNREADNHRSRNTVYAALEAWCDEAEESGLSGNTIRSYRQNALACLEQVGQDPTSKFPAVSTKAVRYTKKYHVSGRPSIAALNWHELSNLPKAQQDAAGLKLVHSTSMATFESEEQFFHVGQAILSDKPQKKDSYHRESLTLKRLIASELSYWKKHTKSQFSERWTESIHQAHAEVGSFETWKALGFPIAADKVGIMSHLEFGTHVIKCFSPSLVALHSAQLVFCCDTGWNKQPIIDLGLEPHVFETEGEVRIGSERVLQSFKTRADHFVFSNGDIGRILRGLYQDCVPACKFDPLGGVIGVQF